MDTPLQSIMKHVPKSTLTRFNDGFTVWVVPYTVIVDGVPILCETASDAIALAREAAGNGATVAQPPSRSTAEVGGGLTGSRWTEQRIKDFFRYIKPQQRKLIDALIETTDARTDE